jgi:hypothetical protein
MMPQTVGSPRSPSETLPGPFRLPESPGPGAPTIDSGDSLRGIEGPPHLEPHCRCPSPKSSAERVRLYRKRRKAQLRVLPVEVDECNLADYLLASGLLERSKLDDPAELAAVLSRLVARWIRNPEA